MTSSVHLNPVDFADVQGLVRFGHGRLTQACYLLARIKDPDRARAWCRAAPVTTAETKDPLPDHALQVAFTARGLRLLLPASLVAGFSDEFLSGMAGSANRSRRLGDLGANDPATWAWGREQTVPDLAVLLFARTDLEGWRRTVEGPAWNEAFDTLACLATSDMGGFEPFGFTDGVSQPEIDWARARDAAGEQVDYPSVVALGEVLLGYPNEYGKYTERPLLEPGGEAAVDLLPAEDQPTLRDLGRNGTYLVLRQLEQDVRGFWTFLDRSAGADPKLRAVLAAAVVGRQQGGEPLIPASAPNAFTYDGDPQGIVCPLGAHIRRANPRNADFAGHPTDPLARLAERIGLPRPALGRDLLASTRFHRILRRGREYGERLAVADALAPAPPDEAPRGLQFVCLNANIARQFEFIQGAWLMSTKFNGLSEESDPLLGNRAPVGDCPLTGSFSIQRAGEASQKLEGLPQFVTVRGGAYFFLPSIRALRFIARGEGG